MAPQPLPPKPSQLALLRSLAQRTGTTFTYPRTRRQASEQITALLARPRSTRLDMALDRAAVLGGDVTDDGA